ncbi:MAG: thiol reductase thioredoxin [Spirochaetaceae bacterium]|jgi:thioredoxin 1|nr:thiol reductase thioredoxin [Spirochaetaceae bacterium]
MNSVIHVTNDNFEAEVLRSPIPVLADFWSPGCAPCARIAPILEEFAQEYAGRMRIAKINADEETALASRFMITAVPTIIIFRNGAIFRKRLGALPKPQLKDLFEDII